MITIQVEGLGRIQRNLDSIRKGLSSKPIAMALNKVARSARTEADRGIREVYEIRQKDVLPRLRVIKAHKGKLQSVLEVTDGGRSMNAIHFLSRRRVGKREMAKRGKRPQLRFKFRKDRGEKIIKGAFIGNQGRTVFKRTGKGRLPIEAVQTVGIPSMFNSKRVRHRIIARIKKDLPVEMDRAVAKVLRDIWKKRR